jgi:hypothetical protein
VIGDQTPESVTLMGEATKKFLETEKSKLVLDDITRIGNVGKEARQTVVDYGKMLSYDRLAMLGSNGLLQLGSNLMLAAVGKGNKVKYFQDRDKAISWLLVKKRK